MFGFWLFMLVMDLLVPAVMIVFGRLFFSKAPHTINCTFGYRTAMSMKNQDTWQFAHQYCGKLWLRLGWILVPLSIIPMLFVIGKDIETIANVGLGVSLLQLAPMAGSIFLTEIALKKVFDKNGRKKHINRREEAMEKLLATLWGKKASEGYTALKELLAISQSSNALYPYMEDFIEKIDSDNSYFRTRALALIAANAKWDTDYKIDENIEAILAHITDPKPITARQFIKDLPLLAQSKPDLRQDILNALHSADALRYPLSMRPLVEKDIRRAILEIEKQD